MYVYIYTHIISMYVHITLYTYILHVNMTYVHIMCIRINTLDFILPLQI